MRGSGRGDLHAMKRVIDNSRDAEGCTALHAAGNHGLVQMAIFWDNCATERPGNPSWKCRKRKANRTYVYDNTFDLPSHIAWELLDICPTLEVVAGVLTHPSEPLCMSLLIKDSSGWLVLRQAVSEKNRDPSPHGLF
eukprot:scaffold40051_cov23-Prasinocladus_malaysianus.AAC.9